MLKTTSQMPKQYDLSRRDETTEEKVVSGICEGDSMEESAMKLGLEKSFLFPKYKKLYPDFEDMCLLAIEALGDKLENDLMYVCQKYDEKSARIMSDNIKKRLEYINPKKYSPRQQHDITVGIPDIGKALDDAERRVVEANTVVQLTGKKK